LNYLFDNEHNQYLLFSGSSLDDAQGAFRHLNDLFFILYVLYKKGIESSNITLCIDNNILDSLDSKTNMKKSRLVENAELTYCQIIKKLSGSIIDLKNFENKFQRDKNRNFIFFSSGHGNIHGLSTSSNSFISPDYFEKLASSSNDKFTFLYLSQCIAGAFHHLDTREKIFIFGASEYQNSISIPIEKLILTPNHDNIMRLFSFYGNIPINPFIFTFFITMLSHNLIRREKKNMLNLYKYINSSTIELIKQTQCKVLIDKNDFLEIDLPVIQQPYLLNKNLASEVMFERK
jgi:hypothetical protein